MMRKRTVGNERGFTLIELLIVIVLLGAIAAFLVPNLIGRTDDAEITRVASDLRKAGDAVQMFQLDTRGALPGDLEDLANAISTSEKTALGVAYTATHVTRWDGPYLKNAISTTATATEGVVTTGFGGTIANRVVIFTPTTPLTPVKSVASPATCVTGEYIALQVIGSATPNFGAINNVIDGSDETTPGTQGAVRQITGATASADDGIYFIIAPCK